MNGYITGGWNYVFAAYGVTATALTTYLASIVLRLHAEARAQQVMAEAARVESERLPPVVPAQAVS